MIIISLSVLEKMTSALKLPFKVIVAEARFAAAIHWSSQGRVLQEMAAVFSGLHRVDFLARTVFAVNEASWLHKYPISFIPSLVVEKGLGWVNHR